MSLIDTLAVKVSNLILQGADMSDKQFFEREIQKWKDSPQRIMQIKGHLYYDNEHDILHRKRMMIGEGGKLEEVDNLPNNRLIDNQYAKLVNQKANYLLGQPFAIEGENQQYVELLKKVFNKRFMKTLKAAGKAMLNNGICWLYPYYTETGEFSFRMFPGYEVLPFWKDTEHTILEAAVRLYLVVGYQIIRSIDKKNAPKPSPTTPMIDQILRGRNKEIHLTSNETKALAQEISVVKAESKSFQDEKESTEKKYRYDVRILNVLATTGLKASSIAHELKNDRNSVSVNYQYIVDALKEYGFWEDLCSQEYTEYSYKNVPQLLSRNKAINQKIVAFMDTMLDEIEKKKFSPRSLSVNSIMENIKANWMRDYASLLINLNVDESVYFETSEDIFTAIFDNLILNSWQQNKASSQIVINISIHKVGSLLKIVYEDSGVGLPPKYINDPMRILEVHESSRENGHGLGMWIVHNTIRMTGGDVISIDGHNGFHFNFELGEKL